MKMKTYNYKLKIISSKDIITSFLKNFPIACSKINCSCEITIKTKWYLFMDIYTLEITDLVGDNYEEIEKLVNLFKIL
jgi:hypothetical protein